MRASAARRLATAALTWIAGAWIAAPAFAACCLCSPSGSSQVAACLTDPAIQCADLAAQSGNPNIKGYTCEQGDDATCGLTTAGGSCPEAPVPAATYAPKPQYADIQPIIPEFSPQTKIPGLEFSKKFLISDNKIQIPFLAEYLQSVFRYLTGISVVAAAIMIVWGGFHYVLGGTLSSVQKGKSIINDAVVGLFLVFGINTILQTVAPDTINLNAIAIPLIKRVEIEYANPGDIAAVTGKPPIGAADLLKRATDKATEMAGPRFACFVYGSMVNESGGRMDAIGHDENAQSTSFAVGSRQRFIQSGLLFSGGTFDKVDCHDKSCQNAKVLNDDHFKLEEPPDYGLDWRFSHGFGAGQATVFANSAPCPGKEALGRAFHRGDDCYTIQDLMDVDKQIEAMLKHYKACFNLTSNGTDPAQGYICYGGQSLTPDNPIVIDRVKAYTGCLQ